jgi:hypothetical protein
MAKPKTAAYVLPKDASTSAEPQHFGAAFPGLHTPGVGNAVDAIGDESFGESEADERIKALSLPLEKTGAAHPAEGDE